MSEKASSAVESRSRGIRDDWLARYVEEIIEPDLPICDPHHHLWHFPNHQYLLPDLLADTSSGHNIVSTVFVECTAFYREDGPPAMRVVGETEFVNGVAAMSASGRYGSIRACAGIVGMADLLLGAPVESVLEAHVAAGNGRFRGIRHSAAWHPSDAIHNGHTNPPEGLYRNAKFREGFAKLGELGLTFDAWLYHTQIDDLTDLARAFPDQPIMMDHFGGPIGIGPYQGKSDEIFADWNKSIEALAECPNVHVKIGGLGMKVSGFDFHKQDAPPSSEELAAKWRPYMETTIEAFGPERCAFESNFPVDKVSGSYATYWNAFKRIAGGASASEKAALFHDTATRFYSID